MDPEALQAVALTVAAERSVDRVLTQIVQGLVTQPAVALARVWLIGPGDICETCPMRAECPDQTRCLHLSASAGNPSDQGRGLVALGRRVQTISPGHSEDRPHWCDRRGEPHRGHRTRSRLDCTSRLGEERASQRLGGQPLVFRNEVLGVLGLFNRDPCDRRTFAWLRTFADHAAIAIAHARALHEIEHLKDNSSSKTRICVRTSAVMGGTA